MAKTKKEKKEKKAGKRMKKKELVKALLDFFHVKQDEVLSLKYIFEQLHLTTHPLKCCVWIYCPNCRMTITSPKWTSINTN